MGAKTLENIGNYCERKKLVGKIIYTVSADYFQRKSLFFNNYY